MTCPHFVEGDGKMRRQIAAALGSAVLCAAVLALTAYSPLAIAQQKPARACLEEWRANRAANQANGLTEKAYVAQCRAGGAPTQVYSSIKELMESIIDPSADVLWGAVRTVVDTEGVHETFPKTQEEWLDLRHAAVRIIEGGNLLMMPGREGAPAGTKSENPGIELEPAEITALIKQKRGSFDAFAKALRGLGLEALRAIDAKDIGLVLEVGGRMEDVCESCHQTFWYPQGKNAPKRPQLRR
jgi:hypothetical protein